MKQPMERVLQSFHVEGLNVWLELESFWRAANTSCFTCGIFGSTVDLALSHSRRRSSDNRASCQFLAIDSQQRNRQGQLPDLCELGFKFGLNLC